jgi:hypothetical protein
MLLAVLVTAMNFQVHVCWQNARIFTAWEEGRSGLQAVAGPGLLQQKGLRLFQALKSRPSDLKCESQVKQRGPEVALPLPGR